MQIKVDEDLPNLAVKALVERGYQAKGVYEQGMSGWKDHQLWQAIQEEELYLVTANEGFADIRHYPPGKHGGIMLLRPDEDGIRPVETTSWCRAGAVRFEYTCGDHHCGYATRGACSTSTMILKKFNLD